MAIAPESPLDRTTHDLTAFTDFKRTLKLHKLDMAVATERDPYEEQIRELQLKLVNLQRKVGDFGIRVILVFEGMDAAGKGGAIKRLIRYLDPRGYRVHSLGPPSQVDVNHHYLRRFWMRLPKRGRICIFDDYSWYGRMLMEPIEHLCTEEQYERATHQLTEFERTLAEEDYCILKFWIQVDRDEQMKRFQRRLRSPYKSWKMTPEDWSNQEKYDHYMEHAQKIFKETDAPYAPWFLVPGNDKLFTRVQVLKIVSDVLEAWPVQPNLFARHVEKLPWLDEGVEDPIDTLEEDDSD